jgi:hypothetical protein
MIALSYIAIISHVTTMHIKPLNQLELPRLHARLTGRAAGVGTYDRRESLFPSTSTSLNIACAFTLAKLVPQNWRASSFVITPLQSIVGSMVGTSE